MSNTNKHKQSEETASEVVRKYVRFKDHAQYVAGNPAELKRDITQALQAKEDEMIREIYKLRKKFLATWGSDDYEEFLDYVKEKFEETQT